MDKQAKWQKMHKSVISTGNMELIKASLIIGAELGCVSKTTVPSCEMV